MRFQPNRRSNNSQRERQVKRFRHLGWLAALLVVTCVGCGGEETNACEATLDCSGNNICLDNLCQAVSCTTNLDCPPETICYPETTFCGPLECRVDQDCVDRRNPYCVNSRCQTDPPPECSDRSECETGEICDDQQCEEEDPDGECSSDEDCPNPQICDPDQGEDGLCVIACTGHDDCEDLDDLRACDQLSGLCMPVECIENEDCEDDELQCNQGFECELMEYPCETIECPDERPHSLRTETEGMCRCVECEDDRSCSGINDEICTPVGHRCQFCETTAETSAGCPTEAPFFVEGCCGQCEEDVDCEPLGLGSICNHGRCVICNCNTICTCPDNADCETQDDGSGICVPHIGSEGDPCTAQDDCDDSLACSYSDGECVVEGVGSLCAEGCPEPSRCGVIAGGSAAMCFGCHDESECPDGLHCFTPDDWVDVYDGGQCISY